MEVGVSIELPIPERRRQYFLKVGVSILSPILERRKQYGGGHVFSIKYPGGEKAVRK